MNMGRQYDAIILGRGPAGLFAGSLLLERGLKVLSLSHGEGLDHLYLQRQGYVFEPFGGLFTGLQEEGLRKALEGLGLCSVFAPLEPGLQVVLPGQRVNLFSREDRFWRELEREFPEDLQGHKGLSEVLSRVEKALSDLHSEDKTDKGNRWPFKGKALHAWIRLLPYRWKTLPSLLDGNGLGHDSRLFIEALTTFFFNADSRSFPILPTAILWGFLRSGLYSYKRGLIGLARNLEKAFLERGGELKFLDPGDGVNVFQKREVHVRTEREIFRARYLLIEEGQKARLSPWTLWRLQNKKALYPGLKREALVLLLGVKEEILPSEMREHLILYGDGPEKGAIFLSLSPPGDESRPPRGCQALSATLFINPNVQETRQNSLAEEALNRLEDFIPSLHRYIDYFEALKIEVKGLIPRKFPIIGSARLRTGIKGVFPKRPVSSLLYLDDQALPGGKGIFSLLPAFRVAEAILKEGVKGVRR